MIPPFLLYLSETALTIWPLFGAMNQLLAGLSLTVASAWLYRSDRAYVYVAIPMVLVLLVAGAAMGMELARYLDEGNYLLASIGAVVLALEGWVVLEGVSAVRRVRAEAR